MYCECYNTQLFITFKWEQILQTRSHIMMKSQHNSVLHAFSVPDWSEMCGVVGVLTVLLLLPTQYTAGEIVKMWCQEFDKYLLANIYILDIDITFLISDMDFLYQFNLRLHHFWRVFFSNVKKKNQKLAGLWLVGEVVNHVGLYGSEVAEGCSAFQRRSCLYCGQNPSVSGGFPHKGPVMRNYDGSVVVSWNTVRIWYDITLKWCNCNECVRLMYPEKHEYMV